MLLKKSLVHFEVKLQQEGNTSGPSAAVSTMTPTINSDARLRVTGELVQPRGFEKCRSRR